MYFNKKVGGFIVWFLVLTVLHYLSLNKMYWLQRLLLIAVFITNGLQVKALEFESTYRSCLYKYYTNVSNESRDYAQSKCEAWGGTLAIPDSKFIMEQHNRLWTKNNENVLLAHIGGKRGADGAFYWSTGISVNTTYNGWNVNWPIRAGECCMGIRNQMEEPKVFWVTLNTARSFVCQKTTAGADYCNGQAQYTKDANRCQEDCVCKEGYNGRNCEFQNPYVESCMMNSTSPITFPLNITCIITGHGINDLTTIEWKANGSILANNTDNNVFYQHVEMDRFYANRRVEATLILKREFCLGNMTIDVNVFHSFNGKTFISGNHSILLRSDYSTISCVKVEQLPSNETITNVKWESNAPIHLQLFQISTVPATRTIFTNSTEYELVGLSSNQMYQIHLTFASESVCNGSSNVALATNFTAGTFNSSANLRNLSVQSVGSFKCQVSWSYEDWKNVEKFTVLIAGLTYETRKKVKFPQYNASYDIYNFREAIIWEISLPPNKIYTFQVYAVGNCARYSRAVVAQSFCITEVTAPGTIPALTLYATLNGDKIITMQPVDEVNGPVSCVLLVITTFMLHDEDTLLTESQFVEMTSTNGYIAYCIENTSSTTNITLGGNQLTYCDTRSNSITKRSTNQHEIIGNNKPLDEDVYCCAYMISITRSGDTLLYRRSYGVAISKVDKTETSIVLIVVACLSFAVFGVVIGVVIWIWRKRRRSPSSEERSSTHETAYLDHHEHNTTNAPMRESESVYMTPISPRAPVYENVSFDDNNDSGNYVNVFAQK